MYFYLWIGVQEEILVEQKCHLVSWQNIVTKHSRPCIHFNHICDSKNTSSVNHEDAKIRIVLDQLYAVNSQHHFGSRKQDGGYHRKEPGGYTSPKAS